MNPSPAWYATRGAGVALLVVLTATAVLGAGAAARWEGRRTPRVVTVWIHRNLSLLSVVLLGVHIATTVVDPFARITVRDALVPFSAAYRPLWLGLGTVACEVLVAVVMTSLVRGWIGSRAWRLVHWSAYAAWPLAVVHGLGTGSDAQAPWLIGLVAGCIAAVAVALMSRLLTADPERRPLRGVAAGLAAGGLVAIAVWAVEGPLRPGWSVTAGTPAADLAGAASPAAAPARGTGGFQDDLVGTMVRDAAGRTQVALRDVVDPAITLAISPPAGAQTLPVVTVSRGGRVVCAAPARPTSSLYAVCGTTRLTVALYGGPAQVTGLLTASGPLG